MKIKALLYCTKAKPWLAKMEYSKSDVDTGKIEWFEEYGITRLEDELKLFQTSDILNGKIVAECDFKVEKINVIDGAFTTHTLNEKELLNKSCLTFHQMFDYFANTFNYGYAIHIKNLHIFDEPNELFYYDGKTKEGVFYHLNKAPQNMMCAYDIDEIKYILISIRPEWLCKILNGEKTIEVRKKILKEMLKND